MATCRLPLAWIVALLMLGCGPVPVVTPPAPTPNSASSQPPTTQQTPTQAPSPTATPAGYSTNPTRLLLRLEDLTCRTPTLCDPSSVVFVLYGDGRAVYRESRSGVDDEVRMAQLSETEVIDLMDPAVNAIRDAIGDNAFSDLSGTRFDLNAPTFFKSVKVSKTEGALAALEVRLRSFASERGDRSQPPATCDVSPFETIPRNDAVAWDVPIWQRATDGVWAAPLGAMGDKGYVGFPSAVQEPKVLWWVPRGGLHPLNIHITRVPDGIGGPLATDVTLQGDQSFPSRGDRPSGMPGLPPGCYEYAVSINGTVGSLIERTTL